MNRRTAARTALAALAPFAAAAGCRLRPVSPVHGQSVPGDAASDPTPWAQPGPYLASAGFDGFDVVRGESFGGQQRVAVTYFF